MPTASISGTVLNVTGLTVGQQYAMMLYCLYPGNTSYTALVRQPESGTREAATTTWSFNISSYVGNAGTYQFYVHIYAPGQTPQNSNTNVVSYTTQAQTVKVLIRNYLDGSTALTSGSYTGYPGGIFYITYANTQYQTYSEIYDFQYFRLSSDNYQYTYSAGTGITISEGLEVHAYYKSRITPVAPTITNVATTKNSATVYWASNGGDGSTGYWTLFYRTATGAYVSYGNISSSPVTISRLTPGTTYYFKVRHTVNGSYLDSADASATTQALIASFAWTSNDAANIAAGSLISTITAAAWNTLRQRVADCGGTAASVPTATAGVALSTNHFNQMRAAIAALSGAGTVTPAVVVSELPAYRAAQFANDNAALKEAINRAITAKNAS
jgi:hypothetical protein